MKKKLDLLIDIIKGILIGILLVFSTIQSVKETGCNSKLMDYYEAKKEIFFSMLLRYFSVQDKNFMKVEWFY